LKIVTFGEIMLRLAPPGFQRFSQTQTYEASFGGGEANVAVSLANYGETVEFVTRLPKNDLGDACLANLCSHAVQTNHIIRGGNRLGIYFLETGAAQRASKIIYDRAGSSFSEIEPGMIDWDHVFKGVDWFHWTGISPAVSQSAAEVCKEAILAARSKGIIVSCDLNYRAKLWKWGKSAREVMQDLVSQCQVALGNEEDAEKVFGIHAPESEILAGKVESNSYRAVCEELASQFPTLQTIVVTLRGSLSASHNTWSGVLWQAGVFFQTVTYDILPIVDRVGGGDAFMGGLIYGLRHFPADPQKALSFATAAACLKHSIPGDFNAVSLTEVENLMAGDASGRVSR
jgi:2-dehydro-3-deoxygluconokinase